jgi:hypothetical protein
MNSDVGKVSSAGGIGGWVERLEFLLLYLQHHVQTKQGKQCHLSELLWFQEETLLYTYRLSLATC